MNIPHYVGIREDDPVRRMIFLPPLFLKWSFLLSESAWGKIKPRPNHYTGKGQPLVAMHFNAKRQARKSKV